MIANVSLIITGKSGKDKIYGLGNATIDFTRCLGEVDMFDIQSLRSNNTKKLMLWIGPSSIPSLYEYYVWFGLDGHLKVAPKVGINDACLTHNASKAHVLKNICDQFFIPANATYVGTKTIQGYNCTGWSWHNKLTETKISAWVDSQTSALVSFGTSSTSYPGTLTVTFSGIQLVSSIPPVWLRAPQRCLGTSKPWLDGDMQEIIDFVL